MLREKDWPSEKKINFLSHNPKKNMCVLSEQNFKNVSSSLQKDVVSGLRNLMDKGGCEERASGFQVKIASSAKIEDFWCLFLYTLLFRTLCQASCDGSWGQWRGLRPRRCQERLGSAGEDRGMPNTLM